MTEKTNSSLDAEVTKTSNSNEPLASGSHAVKNPINADNAATEAKVKELENKVKELENKSKTPKAKTPYYKVTERFRTSFGSQVIKTAEAKRAVFEKSFSKTVQTCKDYTREEFCTEFRDCVFNKLLVNIKFVGECLALNVNAFEAAQFIAMQGNPTVESVLKNGVGNVFKDNLNLLKGCIFTEAELATVKFTTITLKPTEEHLTEAERLISAIGQVLDIMGKAA